MGEKEQEQIDREMLLRRIYVSMLRLANVTGLYGGEILRADGCNADKYCLADANADLEVMAKRAEEAGSNLAAVLPIVRKAADALGIGREDGLYALRTGPQRYTVEQLAMDVRCIALRAQAVQRDGEESLQRETLAVAMLLQVCTGTQNQ